MASDYGLSHSALIDRADRAIANAVAIRSEVRAGLEVAGRRSPIRPWIGDPKPSQAPPLPPSASLDFLELWRSVARNLSFAGQVIREADVELERAWHRILPTIETPMTLFEG